jgi:transketolase
LVFSDYMRPAVRLAALSKLPAIYVWTHDSIGLGEDGPTHQPIEHLMALRVIPNLHVIRPADANETAEAWRLAMERTDGPTALVLTRQKIATLDRSSYADAAGTRKGAYVVADGDDAIVIATGSELTLALAARELLAKKGVSCRVVSMPCWELFEAQADDYRESVLPEGMTARVSVEAGVTLGWRRYLGDRGRAIGVDRFGASAPGEVNFEKFGFTPESVAATVKRLL